jgi:hypothetical protein
MRDIDDIDVSLRRYSKKQETKWRSDTLVLVS